jgi:hypothetical protein
VSKIRHFCNKVHCSTVNRQYLNSQQIANNEPQKKVVMDLPTRWNSTFDMLLCASEMPKSLTAFSIQHTQSEHSMLDENDWRKIDSIIKFLEPFKHGNLLIKSYYFLS